MLVINLNAIDDITTASLSTTDSGNVNISLGKIGDKEYDSKGNVTTGNITAKEVDILSDGAFRTHGDIQTKDGDVNITALKDIVVHNITSKNAGISLISGTDAITATGEIIGDYGVTALAKQNITTDKIQSANDVVLLNSSQGAVTVNGAITSNSDVSLSAFKNVVTQDITSMDGAVALISSSGNVKAQGAIASVDNVTLGASGNVVAQNITSTYGTVALVSNSGAVSASHINAGSDVVISAKQNINTGKINSWEGTVTLTTKQGTVTTTGDITTNNGDVYISSAGDAVSQNIISNGGAITVVSSVGSLKTGYLRSDGQGTGGKIYLRAADFVRVTGSLNINHTNYSIYTGTNKKDWVKVIYGNGNSKFNKSKIAFLIGDATTNGTAAQIELETSVTILKPAPLPPKLVPGSLLIPIVIEEIFRNILDGGSTAPGYVDEINPITGGRYRDQQEYQLINQQLTPNQRDEIKRLVNNPNYGLTMKYVEQNGKFSKEELNDNHRCYGFLLPKHLGNDKYHDKYATDVTGSKGDFIVIPPNGVAAAAAAADPLSQIYRAAFYDGIVVPHGASVKPPLATLINPPQQVGDLAEVKTGYEALSRIVAGNPLPQREINSDVSLSAFKNVVTQDITSMDGAVALISSSGNLKAQGGIASADNVSLGASGNVVAQNIISAFGTVALVSSKGNVTTTEINSGSQLAMQADQNVITGKITSQWGKVALIAKQGTVTTQGDITTHNGEVYISSVGDVISQNIISNGGVIAIASSQGAVKTGYLRSDGNHTGGKIYVQADGSVRVTGSVSINDANYSIYTGVKKKGLISIAYESGILKSNKSKFLIGDARSNGTAAHIYGPYAFKDDPTQIYKDVLIILQQVLHEILKGNDNQPTTNPSNVADINPITGNPYRQGERELVEQLKIAQQRRLNVLIHNENNPERITEQEVFTKGKVETDDGCFNLELDRHLGKDITHDKYATYVTGSPGDYLVITPSGLFAFYDGLVRAKGAIVNNGNGSEPVGSVAEVKTGYRWLKTYLLLPDAPNYTPPTQSEKNMFRKMISQIDREAEVAKDCGLQYFMCFSDKEAGLAARDMFEYKQPPYTRNSVPVHHIRLPSSL